MKIQYHILNGDALMERFPDSIPGEKIVCRECLVDGDVSGETLNDFYNNRAEFLARNYNGASERGYFEKSVPEFQKIQQIPTNSVINLWFEDDLFCQVNFWFVANLLYSSNHVNNIFLVRPNTHTQYGFAGLSNSELCAIFEKRLELKELNKLALLWEFYKNKNTGELKSYSKQLKSKYPFIFDAVEAHIQRLSVNGIPGRPIQSLITIMKELNTNEFGPVFKEFCKREYIYGFGDLQVKRLLDKIENKNLAE